MSRLQLSILFVTLLIVLLELWLIWSVALTGLQSVQIVLTILLVLILVTLSIAGVRKKEAPLIDRDRNLAVCKVKIESLEGQLEITKTELKEQRYKSEIVQDEIVEARQRLVTWNSIREQIDNDRLKAETERGQAENKRRHAEELHAKAARKEKEAADLLIAASNREAKCREQAERLEQKKQELEKREHELQQRERAVTVKDAEVKELSERGKLDLAAAQAARDAAEAARQETVTAESNLQTLRHSLWPTWISEDSLQPSIADIEHLSGCGSANAALLLSYLAVFRAIENHPSTNREFNYLWATVREIGRFLSSLLAEQGVSPQESADCMTHWAKTLNQVSRGRFTVGVPLVGGPFNSAQMQSTTPGIQSVSRVNNWSVNNAKAITASKAEVS